MIVEESIRNNNSVDNNNNGCDNENKSRANIIGKWGRIIEPLKIGFKCWVILKRNSSM